MPKNIKIGVSVFVLLVGLVYFLFERSIGDPFVGTIGGILSIFMVFAMWVFPETEGRKPKD